MLAQMIALELRKAELNMQWGYMASLLNTVKELGGRVMRIPDERFSWRADYMIQFRWEDTLPGTYSPMGKTS